MLDLNFVFKSGFHLEKWASGGKMILMKKNGGGGGGKGSARECAPARGSGGMLPQKIFEFYTL